MILEDCLPILLFILFDIEVAFLIPYALASRDAGMAGFWAVMAFLTLLTAGLAYEWKKGALNRD